MAYFEQSDLLGYLPAEYLRKSVDDGAQGTEEVDPEVYAGLLAATEVRLRGLVAPAVTVTEPLSPYLKYAAVLLAVDMAYRRRGVVEHPWKDALDSLLETLRKVQEGTLDVDEPTVSPMFAPETTSEPLTFDGDLVQGAY
jgi:hypothetical protein